MENKARVAWVIAAVFLAATLFVGGGAVLNDLHIATVDVDLAVAITASAPPQPRGDTVMHVGAGGSGGTGAVEEMKGFYAGRPLFKVPPSSPCREKAVRC